MSVTRLDHTALGSRDIAQLIAVADCGSIRRAAEALGMTQPGLSKNIRLIEERLGMHVFDRSTTGAVPTAGGQQLLQRGRQILLDLHAINRDLKEDLLSEAGKVRIGCGPVVAPMIAGEAIPQALATFPKIAVELEVAFPGGLLELLVRGELDFVIGSLGGLSLPVSLAASPLLSIVPLVFARKGHPLAEVPGLTMARLAGWKLAMVQNNSPFEDWLTRAIGTSMLDIAFQCDDYEMLGRVVEKSDMLCITSPYVFRQLQRGRDIVALPIADIDFAHRVSCIQPASRILSRPAQRILDLTRTALSAS